MNNLPTTFTSLLDRLYEIRGEAYADVFDTYDYDLLAEKLLTLLEQYDAKEEE